jgi:O-antigen ligase
MDILLATVLAVYPLLPSGPLYFGLADAAYSRIGFVLLLAVWLIARVREPQPLLAASTLTPGREVLWAWGAFLIAATGATAVGLSAENDLSSPVFWAYVREIPAGFGSRGNMLSDPMYPVSVWLVMIQGGLAFAAVRDLCLRASNPSRRARTALYGWLTGYGLVAGVAVIQYATKFQLHPYWVTANPNLVRSHSTLEDPNMLGSYLVLGLGVVLSLVWVPRAAGTRTGRWFLALGVLGVAALYTTVSRAAWMGFPFALTLLLAFTPREWVPHFVYGQRHLRFAARGLLLGLVIVGFTVMLARVIIPPDGEAHFQPANPLEAVVRTFDPRLPLSQGYVFGNRIDWWHGALQMFAERPLLGVGLGRYPRLVHEYSNPNVPPENAHNFLLQTLGEMGGLGFTGLILLLGAIFMSLATFSRISAVEEAAIARGSLLGVTAFLLTCLSGHPLLLASGQVLLATMLAATLVASGSRAHESTDAETTSLPHPHALTHRGRSVSRWKTTTSVVAGLAALCYPAATFGHMSRYVEGTSTWGYSWGLFGEENTDSDPFRWTGHRAIIDLKLPPGRGTSLELRVAVPFPIRGGQATHATFRLGNRYESETFQTTEPVTVLLELGPEDIPDDRHVLLVIDVDPVFVPSEIFESSDKRELGLQLFSPIWKDNIPRGPPTNTF